MPEPASRQFRYEVPRLASDLQDGQRVTDLIVKRLARGDGWPECLNELRRQVLGRGLAGRACDPDDGQVRHAIDGGPGDLAQRSLDVGHDERRSSDGPRGQDRDRASGERHRREHVAVGARAGQGREQAAGPDLVRVDDDRPGDQHVRVYYPVELSAGSRGDLGERERDHESSASRSVPPRASDWPSVVVASSAACRRCRASAATSRSSNGMTAPPMYWPSSWPLPAISTTSPLPADLMARSIATARSGCTTT